MDNRPIGIFDSGLGGISVLNRLVGLLPREEFIYLGDSAWCPYGDKNVELVRERTVNIVRYLISRNVKLIVVACNTATGLAIGYLRESFNIPFVGMEPAIKPAAKLTKTNTVGVLATRNTFNGTHFRETSKKYAKGINAITQVGDGLVELVEENQVNSKRAHELIKKYTEPMCKANADHVVLGCTHYPFLSSIIKEIAPGLKVIDPALPVAKRAQQLLTETDSLSVATDKKTVELLTTGSLEKITAFAGSYIQYKWKAASIDI